MNRTYTMFLVLTLLAAKAPAQDVQLDSTGVAPADASDVAWQLKNSARQSFRNGDSAKAREQLATLLELYRREVGDDRQQWCQHLAKVACEYLHGGELRTALQLIGEAADLNMLSDEAEDDALTTAAAGMHRRLAGLDAEERFELLYKWSLPTEERRSVRVLTSIVPTVGPPPVFARALGERPSRNAFAAPDIGGIHGLFNTGWELVTAADEAGRLRALSTEVEQLVEGDVPNARFVQLLVQIVEAKREDEELAQVLHKHLLNPAETAESSPSRGDIVIAAACLTRDWLQSIGEEVFKGKIEAMYDRVSPVMRPFLRTAHASAVRRRYRGPGRRTDASEPLRYWISSSVQEAARHAQGAVQSVWLAHEDHIMHLAGPRSDYLFLKYPLTGEFEFSCDAQIGGGTDGCLAYGGLGYELSGAEPLLRVWDAGHGLIAERPRPFVNSASPPTFNRFSLKSTVDGITCFCNRHPIWTDTVPSDASPWIALRSDGAAAPVFRNLKLSGNPVIPRTVQMSSGDSLRGWSASYYGERLAAETLDETVDWSFSNEIIYGAKLKSEDEQHSQSWLYYLRPLLDGESIRYEFWYQPGQVEVHPTIGRLALLVEPDGVRLHWMTDEDHEWTGLAVDNSVAEPLDRRGPKPLPLRAGEWNAISIALRNDQLDLLLNGTAIYSRQMEAGAERTFGFYHNRSRTEARVRHVAMRGDWPERLTAVQPGNLTASSRQEQPEFEGRIRTAIFGERHVHGAAIDVLDRAERMSPQERYAFLADWVLPSKTHDSIRMTGQFTSSGLHCPAVELVHIAERIGQLERLRDRVARLPESHSDEQRRAIASMLFLVDLASGDETAAAESILKLATLAGSGAPLVANRQWPQMTAAWVGLRHPKSWPLVADLITEMRTRHLLEPLERGTDAWSEQLASMSGLLQHRTHAGSLEEFLQPPRLNNWIAANAATAQTSAGGYPGSHWRWDGDQIQNLSSHRQSFLFYKTPLRGDVEISCELPVDSWHNIQLMYAGEYVVPQDDYSARRIGNVREEKDVQLDPPLTKPLGPPWYRIEVRDRICTIWFNGRMIRRRRVAEDHEPWLAIRTTSSQLHPSIRDLRIDGTPDVPDAVNLCAYETLSGWWSYFDEEIGPGKAWEYVRDDAGKGMRSIQQPDYRGVSKESLLRYYRPLADDDSLEYDFFYKPGASHAHPALDGLAFLIEPDGVRLHPVTDGKYEQTGADPAGTVIEPQCRRGPSTVPLKGDDWNRCRLTLRAGVVDLSLNDQTIYSRPLAADNQRQFGFFHYAGESEVQVRNVIWRHQPAGSFESIDQQLVNRCPNLLDDKLATFQSFSHDFVTSGLPTELFEVPSRGDVKIEVTSEGVTHYQRSDGKWADSSIGSVHRMCGDFDLTASFADLRVTEPHYGGSAVVIREMDGRVIQLSRRLQDNLHRVYLTWRDPVGDGEFRFAKDVLITEALAGRFRVARRGDTYSFLFAEYDSSVFRVVGEQTIDGAARQAAQLELRVIASIGASASVLWKNVHLAADQLMRYSFRAVSRDVTNEQWAIIASTRDLRELMLDATNISNEDLAKLKNHLELRLLYLKDTRITSRGLQHLAHLKKLENLHLTSSTVEDDAARTIRQFSELRTLGLSYTRIGDAAIRDLSRLGKLEVLGLNRTLVTDESVADFSKMTSLRTLDLRNTEMSEAGIERIRRALPKCTVKY